MYAWENSIANIVMATRREELNYIKYSSFVTAFLKGNTQIIARCALYISMVTYSLFGNVLTASITFVLAAFYNNLQMTIAIYLPPGYVSLGEIIVSIKRVKVRESRNLFIYNF